MAERHDTAWDDGLREAFAERRRRRATRDETTRPPARVERFEHLGEIARDETSLLLRARDREVDRDVALRVLADTEGRVDAARRFLEEAQLAAQLQHPGILSVYGMGTLEDGRPFLALPVVDGPTLADVLAETNGSPAGRRRRVALVEQVAHALAYAHARGVAHGRLDASRVHLGEKGVVAVSGWDGALRTNGDSAPIAADVRALGTLLVAALGEARDDDLAAVTIACASGGPRHAGEVARRIAACLAEEEAGALRAELDAARERVRAAEEQARVRLERRRSELARRSRRRIRAAAAAVLLAVVLGGGGMLWRRAEGRSAAARAEAVLADALHEAERHETARNWAEARAWAAKADALADTDTMGPDRRERARALRSRIDRAARIARASAGLLPRLESIAPAWDGLESWDEEMSAAFREAGLDIERLEPAAAAAALRCHPEFEDLVGFVDSWWLRRRGWSELAGRDWEHLLAVVRAADPDRDRTEIREALVRNDADRMRTLLRTVDLPRLPRITCRLLGEVFKRREPEAALSFLRRARQRYPGDGSLVWTAQVALGQLDRPDPLRHTVVTAASLAIYPDYGWSWHHLSLALSSRGDHAGAVAAARRAIELRGGDSPADWLNLGLFLGNLDRFEEAIRATEKALELEPGWPDARSNLITWLARQGKHEEAVALARELVADAPGLGWADLCFLFFQLRQDERAIEAGRKALEHGHESPVTWFSLGRAHQRLGHVDEAIAALRRGIELSESGGSREAAPGRMIPVPDPSNVAGAHLNLGCALATKRDFEGAIRETRAAIALDPTQSASHNNLGTYLLQLRRWAEAEAPLRKALELWEDSPDAHTNLGVSLLEQGRLEEAEPHLRRATELVPGDDRYQNHLAQGLFRLGKLDEARSAFEKSIAVRPDRAPTRWWLAATLDGLGRPAEAEREYRKAVELEPSPSFLNGLARHLVLASGVTEARAREAVDLARRAVRAAPNEGGLWNTLGVAFYRAGDHENALKALDRGAQIQGGMNAMDCLWIAMVHGKLGHADEARESYAKGVTWMETARAQELFARSPADGEFCRRIRAEAEAVLGIEKETKTD